MIILTDIKNRTMKYAAEELGAYLKKMTGVDFEAVGEGNADIILSVDSSLTEDPMIYDRYIIEVEDGKGSIKGSSQRSVLLGVYRYLKELGCRFVRPGEFGDVIPKKQLSGTKVSLDFSPFYPYRVECDEGALCEEFEVDTIKWLPKAGYNAFFIQGIVPYNHFYRWYKHEKNPYKEPEDYSFENAKRVTKAIEDAITLCGLQFHDVGHAYAFEPWGMHYLTSWAHTYTLPDEVKPYVALIDGKREIMHNSINFTNLCYSDEVVKEKLCQWFVDYIKEKPYIDFLHIFLADNINNQCECEKCINRTISDIYVDLLNAVDEAFTKNNIKQKIVSAQYVDTRYAPKEAIFKNPDRFILMPAISRTFEKNQYDGKYDKELPADVRNKFVSLGGFKPNMAFFEGWKEKFDNPYMFFEYHLYAVHYFDPGYMNVTRDLSLDIQMLRNYGSSGMVLCKTQRCYLPLSLPAYAAGVMLENPDANLEEITKEYFEAAFGREGDNVREYLEKVSEIFSPELLRVYVDVYSGEDKKKLKRLPKWFDNKEAEKQFMQLEPVVAEFEKLLDGYMDNAEDECKKHSFLLLKYHAEIIKRFAAALVEGARGNAEGAKEKAHEMLMYVAKNEDAIAREFDYLLFANRIEMLFNTL